MLLKKYFTSKNEIFRKDVILIFDFLQMRQNLLIVKRKNNE